MCSVVYAQNKPVAKPKKSKDKQKIQQNLSARDSLVEINAWQNYLDSLENDSSLTFTDPMDSVKLRKSPSALKSKVIYNSRDTIVYNADKKKIYLYGDAKSEYEDMKLTADFIQIDVSKSIVSARPTFDTAGKPIGVPKFKQANSDYHASKIDYNFKSKKGYLSEFKTKEGEGFVRGVNVKKNESNEFGIKQSSYTICDADTPHFQISAARLKVIPEKKVVGLWPNLVIEGINTPLIFPFAIFPLKKGQSSGIVIPQYGSDISRGFFLRGGGYYFGLGEHADLQLTGDMYSNFSWGGHAVYKYSSRYHFNGNLVFNYADNQFGLPEDPGFHRQKDFQLTWIHMQDGKARPGTTFSANVNLVSSNYLALNSYNPQNMVSNQMASSISFGKSMGGGKYNFSTNARVSQNTQTRDVSISFPDFNYSVSSFSPFKSKYKASADKWYEYITTSYNTQFRNQFDSKDSLLFVSRSNSDLAKFYDTTGRYGMIHTFPVQASFKVMKYFTLSTGIDFTDYMYMKTVQKYIDSSDKENIHLVTKNVDGFQNAITYRPRVSLNTRFYGMKQFSSGPISAIRHVINPSIGLSYSPDFSDPSFGYYKSYKDQNGNMVKYSIFERGLMGTPGAGKQGGVNFSLDNNLEMKYWKGKDSARKEEKLTLLESFAASGFYNLLADSFQLSNINLSARTRLFKNISINATSQLDPYVNEIYTVNGYTTYARHPKFAVTNGGGLG
ncbi:MAG: putative LPS assembly protein LptD, partial [Bacteroidia bacterium]